LSALDINFMRYSNDTVVFHIQELMKNSRPGNRLPALVLKQYNIPNLCVVKTLHVYIDRTSDVRKTSRLFISFASFDKVTTSTLARWLKTVLNLAGIDSSLFKSHEFRGAATSAAYGAGCSLQTY